MEMQDCRYHAFAKFSYLHSSTSASDPHKTEQLAQSLLDLHHQYCVKRTEIVRSTHGAPITANPGTSRCPKIDGIQGAEYPKLSDG